MFEKYRITVIHIRGKGNVRVNHRTNCLKSYRQEVAKNNDVRVGQVSLTYEEKEVCYEEI
ncbi:hypothetical protein GGR21_002491 [Dysgonomonas hofstadii]|uniref:Uncharacterized protein n=1 Tax=Dysgonomonas hofstadii TaxID=637886 RepID=A0A840CUS2_9BACT|nr:hypothetical protein [Dysgonomonas hofstadii]